MNEVLWNFIAEKAETTGLTKVIIGKCVFEGRNGNVISLSLDESHRPLLSDNNIIRMKNAVSAFLGQNIEILINAGEVKKTLFEFNGVFSVSDDGTTETVSWRFGELKAK